MAGVQALLLVYNDAVTALVSGTEGQLEGCVLIAGTGLLVCHPPVLLPCLHLRCCADQTKHCICSTMHLHTEDLWQLLMAMHVVLV